MPSAIRGFTTQVARSARNLYRAIPRDRQTLAQVHRQKVGRLKEAGIKQVMRDGAKTAVGLLSAARDLATLVLPQMRKPKPGSFAFFVHPRDIHDIYTPFPSFKYLPDSWVMEFSKYLPPITASKITGIRSLETGQPLDGHLMAIVLTPQHMLEDGHFAARRAVQMALLAQRKGIAFVGLGALLPFLTRYGKTIKQYVPGIGVTTGHAYTSHIIAKTALRVKDILSPERRELIAVVGAAGSTGSASTKVLLRNGAERLLLIELEEKKDKLDALGLELKQNFPRAEIKLSTRLADIRQARIIVTVTNAPEAIIEEEWLRPGMIFVDDAQPPNVSQDLAQKRQDIRVIKVLAHVPDLDPHFDFRLGTPPDITFTCLAETATLAAHEKKSNFTVGYANKMAEVSGIARLTRRVGVTLPEDFYGYEGVRYTAEEVRQVGSLWTRD
ncbi:polysaccharide biosynthesis protein [Candidatus Margulisiibacteriota bacterium]